MTQISHIRPTTEQPAGFVPGPLHEPAMRSGTFKIRKWSTDEAFERGEQPDEEIVVKNAYINAGSAVVLSLIGGLGGTSFSNANAYIGVGDSTTAVVATQTDLQAAVNKLRVNVDATYPSLAGQVLTWHATFGSTQANWAWNEAALFNGSGGGAAMLSRIVQNLGTKSGGTWTISYTIQLP